MIVNDIITGFVAIIIAYLLGSIPSAYIITRLLTGKDIRQLGGGNTGARNVFVEVGRVAGSCVGVIDLAKGAVAVLIAYRLFNMRLFELQLFTTLEEPQLFILLAALAVVVGHIRSIFLKFTGGNGLATTIGVLAMIMPRELLIIVALTIIVIIITRNPILSLNISLLSVPISAWFLEKSVPLVVFSIILLVIMILNFLPTARADLTRTGSGEKFVAELMRRDKPKQE